MHSKLCTFLTAVITAVISLQMATAQDNTYIKKEKEEFQKVAKRLDPYGNFFLYMGTKDVVKGMDNLVVGLEKNLMPLLKEKDSQNAPMIQAGFNALDSLYRSSGIRDVGGFGISSAQIGKNTFRTKSFLQHTPSSQGGKLWKVMGGNAHDLTCIKYLPKETAMAFFGDLDLNELWAWHHELVKNSKSDQVIALHKMQLDQLMQMVNIPEILGSTDKTIGLVITLDTTSPVSIPIKNGKATLKVPEPGIAIFVKIKDAKLNAFIQSKLVMPQNGEVVAIPFQEKTIEGIACKSYPFPMPLPFHVAPTIATVDNFLVFASSPKVMETIILAKKKGTGLNGHAGFKKLMAGMPTKGNAFSYTGKIFTKELRNVQKQITALETGEEAEAIKKIVSFFDTGKDSYMVSVCSVNKDGIASISKSNINGAKLLVAQATVVPAAIGAGMLLPVLSKSREKARRANCSGNLKQMAVALLMYTGDYSGKFPDKFSALAEKNYLPPSKVYVCPSSSLDAPKSVADIAAGKTSYLYFGKGCRDDNSQSSRTVILADKPGNHDDWINAVFIDGHVEGGRASSIEELARQRGWILSGAKAK